MPLSCFPHTFRGPLPARAEEGEKTYNNERKGGPILLIVFSSRNNRRLAGARVSG